MVCNARPKKVRIMAQDCYNRERIFCVTCGLPILERELRELIGVKWEIEVDSKILDKKKAKAKIETA
jgi:hypothetical protein